MKQIRRPPPSAQRGVGALVIVMVLFFIMSMVAAYASRNLIFEQKTSANNYRSTQAFEAAEAGLEWATAMLNGGRVDNLCVGSAAAGNNSFRERHLSADATGVVSVRKWVDAGVDKDLHPTCVRGGAGWSCSCPPDDDPTVADPAIATPTPVFRITFEAVAGQPGLVRVFSQGCSAYGTPCIADAARRSDAVAEVNTILGLAASLTQTPAAALTVRGRVDAATAQVSNPDGLVINAGGVVNAPNATGPAGSPPLVVPSDPALSNVTPAGAMTRGEMMFLATFGMAPAVYRNQPAVVRLTCGDACAVALQAAATQHPGRVLWVDGNLNVEPGAALTLGTVAAPVILVVAGNVSLGDASNVTIAGMVYSRGANWTNGTATALLQGALVAEGDVAPNDGTFTITGSPVIVFDTTVVERLASVRVRHVLDFGSVVRVPGSWRDFR